MGASEYSNSVYINTNESAEKSVCSNNKHFKLKLDNKISDKFYDAALIAFIHKKKFHIRYNLNKCIDNSVVPSAFMVE